MPDRILFYNTCGAYGSFSNFSRDPVSFLDRGWATSEAAFQAMKFHPHRPDLVQKVWAAPGPKEAASIGRDRANPMHPHWEKPVETAFGHTFLDTDTYFHFCLAANDGRGNPDVTVSLYKDAMMFLVVLAKFIQNPAAMSALLSTKDAYLIEDTRTSGDAYWGWGKDEKGVNRLGKILMSVRLILEVQGLTQSIGILNQGITDTRLGQL